MKRRKPVYSIESYVSPAPSFVRVRVGEEHVDLKWNEQYKMFEINASDPLIIVPNVSNSFYMKMRK